MISDGLTGYVLFIFVSTAVLVMFVLLCWVVLKLIRGDVPVLHGRTLDDRQMVSSVYERLRGKKIGKLPTSSPNFYPVPANI